MRLVHKLAPYVLLSAFFVLSDFGVVQICWYSKVMRAGQLFDVEILLYM